MSTCKNDNTSGSTSTIPSHCFLCISIAGGSPQKVVIELESAKLPKTCKNFASLCAAPGITSKQRPFPTYRGCEFHRIVPKFMVQGGDFEKFNGSGGHSIFGGTFEDEALNVISHDAAGVVSMANRGKDTNGSQFFISLEAAPHLNGKHVAFGRVVEGTSVIHQMATVECEGTQPVPMQRIVIVDCGHGRGPADVDDKKSSNSDAESFSRKRKKRDKKKKHRKHRSHKERRKRDRRSMSSDEDSLSSSSSNDSRERRRKKKKKRKRRRRHCSSDSDSVSSERRRRKSRDSHR